MGSTSKILGHKRVLLAAAWMALSVACAGPAAPALARGAPDSFAELSAKLLPTVVNIATTATMTPDAALTALPDTEDESALKDFFKKFEEKNKAMPRHVAALGSGFIIDPAGLIVTNQHVIDGADTITVTFNDGSTLPATLVGRDDKTDLALLQVHPRTPLAAAEFGDSDRAQVGDWVIAMGDPFGLGSSVTAGIVSARNRDIAAGPYDDFIQTDAPINRGNSGGPLFDMDGHVVGIASAIYSPSGGSVGVGFAIPSNMARGVIAQLRQYGHARRGWMGVRIQSLNGEIADSLGLSSQTGALVADVTAGGPAARAGVRNGDLITQYNGNTVPDSRVLSRLVADTPVGSTVAVEILRNGQKENFRITVAQLDDGVEQGGAAKAPNVILPKAVPGFSQLGLSVAALDAKLRTKYKLGNTDGVVITNVDPAGAAAEEDIREGDMILEVQNEAVHTPGELAKRVNASANSGRKAVLFRVSREGQSSYIAVRLAGGG
ncbi:MAG TPA: Do family serine endopeptidase [Rhizomicrobium sp.]|nr:Do family serine endopeptidase [Rhizomicrobium sp.]